MTEERNVYTVASLQSALQILDLFALQDTWSLSDLTQRLGQGKSRIFRSLNTFEACGYLSRDGETGRYKLGPRLVALSVASVKYEQLRWRALPPLEDLAERTGETVHVGILFDHEVVTVQLVEGRHAVRMHAAVGKRSPAYASSLGKVLLAYFPEPEIDGFLRTAELQPVTPHTLTDPGKLRIQLREIREQGYALDNEEREVGLRCVAAPITDHTGQVSAAVSISAPTTRLSEAGARELVPDLKDTARTISRMLGSPSLDRPGA